MPIFGLRIRKLEPTNYYSAPEECQIDDYALVETEQGVCVGHVIAGPITMLPGVTEEELPAILRLANVEDLDILSKNRELSRQASVFCKKCIMERKLDMKLVDVEIFFDRSKFIFYFTAPNRIDFRELVKDLVREYRSRIELRQIGVRHETQMLGAIGNCGMVCCCRGHLRKFAPVTIKMAKEQNLFLNPTKISGICGRLLCCLSYEQENYENFHNDAPRSGKKYATDEGIVKIIRTSLFKNSVTILLKDSDEQEISLEDWKKLNPKRLTTENYSSDDDVNDLNKNYYEDD